MSASSEWYGMSGVAQLDMIKGSIYRAAKLRRVRVVDASEYVGGTWERIVSNLDGDAPLRLVALRAAAACIEQEARAERKHSAASVREIEDADGEKMSYVEALIASDRDSTETQAIIRVELARFVAGLDSTDKDILNLSAAGYTLREIAPTVNLSHVGVHKRLEKMRAALSA